MNEIKWDGSSIPKLNGKVVIVSGSSSGIGYESARVIATKGAKVIIAVRNRKKGEIALEKIKMCSKDVDVTVMQLDLASLKSVRCFADEFKTQYTRLDILINNAGVMVPPYSKTEDGFELQFGTNHLGHFALTGRLLGLIQSTPDSRIINVSSQAHKAGNINFADLNWEKRKYSAWKAYGDSKIANLYFTYELQKRLKSSDSKVLVTAAHPGWTATELQRNSGIFESLNSLFAQTVEIGALPTLRAAFEQSISGGQFFGPADWMGWRGYPELTDSNSLSHNENIAKKLWEVSENLTGIKYDF